MQADGSNLPDTWVLFCMGLGLPALVTRLQQLYPEDTGVALVIDAGYPEHEIMRCTVGELKRVQDREIPFSRCIIYIGVPICPK